MNRKSFFVGILAAGCFIVSLMLMPNAASAQAADPKVAKAMKLLKAKTAKLGAPMASKPAVSTGHPAAETLGLSRGHQPHGHTRIASRLLGRASYA
jgi:hypothetical protein